LSTLARQIEALRQYAWEFGVQHREGLVAKYIQQMGLLERPMLKDIAVDLIEEVQQARVLFEVLPMDTYGQTEKFNGRVVVSVNSRIREMEGVLDANGVAQVTTWHESIHVARDMGHGVNREYSEQLSLFGDEPIKPRLIVCRRHTSNGTSFDHAEFFAEHAARAAAIAGPDLLLVDEFEDFEHLADRADEVPWSLLYRIATGVGVNRNAFVRYFEHLGLIRIDRFSRRVFGNPKLWPGSRLRDMLR